MLAFYRNLVVAVLLVSGGMSVMAQAAPFSPKQLAGQCADIYRDWLTEAPPRAFALSANGMDCGASWSHRTGEAARADALGQCAAAGGTGCSVVAEDATPPLTVTVGETELIRDCAADYQNWVDQVGPKSFYATEDGTSCGAAWNYPTLQQARKEARRLCQDYGVPCREIDAIE